MHRISLTCTTLCSTTIMVGSEQCRPTLPYNACLSWVWAYLTWTIVWQCWKICIVHISCVGTAARALALSGETVERRHGESGVISPCISSSQQQCVVAQRWVVVHYTMQCVMHSVCINGHNLIEWLMAPLQSTPSCSPSHHHRCCTPSLALQCISLIGMNVVLVFISESVIIYIVCMYLHCSDYCRCTCRIVRCCTEHEFWWLHDLTLHFADTTAALGGAWVNSKVY